MPADPAGAPADAAESAPAAGDSNVTAVPATDGTKQPGAIIPLIVMDDVPLTDAIKNLTRQAGINYMLDPKIGFGQVDQTGIAEFWFDRGTKLQVGGIQYDLDLVIVRKDNFSKQLKNALGERKLNLVLESIGGKVFKDSFNALASSARIIIYGGA